MRKTVIDHKRLQLHSAEICRNTLKEHLTEVITRDRRFLKTVKNALVGRNVRDHPVRVGAQIMKGLWSQAKKFVPYSDAVEYARKGANMLGNLYLHKQTEMGNDGPSWARDLFLFNQTQIHNYLERLDQHIESIFLWQTTFDDLLQDDEALKTTKGRAKLIKSFSKLLLHYREAEKVIGQIEPILEDKARTIESYAEIWAIGSDDATALGDSSILAAEIQFVSGLLLDVDVHADVCQGETCLLSKNPLHMAEFIKDVVTLPPLSLRSLTILEKSYLTSPNLVALGRMKTMLEREQGRLSPTVYKPHVVGLQPAFQLMSLEQWKDFSDIGFWKSRGDETKAIDRALEAYLLATKQHFQTYAAVMATQGHKADDHREPETLENSVRMRAEIMHDVKARWDTLEVVTAATADFVRVKSGKSSSQRRPYILMLDVLLQMEREDLAFAHGELEAE